eukprot:1269035-Pyramimonas_sp.AAC.1
MFARGARSEASVRRVSNWVCHVRAVAPRGDLGMGRPAPLVCVNIAINLARMLPRIVRTTPTIRIAHQYQYMYVGVC